MVMPAAPQSYFFALRDVVDDNLEFCVFEYDPFAEVLAYHIHNINVHANNFLAAFAAEIFEGRKVCVGIDVNCVGVCARCHGQCGNNAQHRA